MKKEKEKGRGGAFKRGREGGRERDREGEKKTFWSELKDRFDVGDEKTRRLWKFFGSTKKYDQNSANSLPDYLLISVPLHEKYFAKAFPQIQENCPDWFPPKTSLSSQC